MEGISHEACSLAGTLGPRQADRVLRRQQHLHRRRGRRVVHRRHPGPLRGLRLARDPGRGRPRRRRRRHRDPWRARGHRSAVAPVLQDDHRIRRAGQGGQGIRARRTARRRRDRGDARSAGLAPIRPSRSPATSTRVGTPASGGSAHHREWRSRFDAWRAAFPREAAEFERRVAGTLPAGWAEECARGLGEADAAAAAIASRKASQNALEAFGASAPRADRRLRRPHRIEPHEVERVEGAEPRGRRRHELRPLRRARVRDERDLQRHRPCTAASSPTPPRS